MMWHTEPLYDDDGTEFMDRHETNADDWLFDLWLYTCAFAVWIALLFA